ncbi:MAG: DUF4012 domain-containing protein [Caldilineaceae bacterium]
MKAALLGRAIQTAYYDGLNFAQVAKSGNLTDDRYALAQTFLQDAESSLVDAETQMNFFKPVLVHAGWLPFYGPTLTAAPELLNAGRQLAALGVQGFGIAKPLLVGPAETSPLTRLPGVLTAAKPQVAELAQQADAIRQALNRISPDVLLTVVADPVANLQATVALLASGLQLSDQLPTLLGADQEQTYLVLVQNNHELRATGGFITSLGTLTIQQGKVKNFAFADSYATDPTRGQLPPDAYPRAPAPMQRYMNIDLLLLRDANWSPDLPTTAQIARTLYAQETGRSVNGVVTIDLRAVELLIGALEPLTVPGSEQALTGATVIDQIKQMWAAPLQSDTTIQTNLGDWWKKRKDFIPQMATAAFGRLQSGAFDYTRMAVALESALDEHALQIWSANPATAAILARLKWDGGLHPAAQKDFLALVDTNMGYNKVDAVIERSLTYQLTWPSGPEKAAQAQVTVTYKHLLKLADYDCDPRPHYGQSYDDMMARCYFDYVRLFVPSGSKLLDVDGVEPDSVTSQHGEAGAEFFAGHFSLHPGQQKDVVFHYQLPSWLKPEPYGLIVQKQAGVPFLPLNLQIDSTKFATTIQSGQWEWSMTGKGGSP